MFKEGAYYTRKQVWNTYHPGEDYPDGGNWNTGYVRDGTNLVIFANVGVPGRTGHDFPNAFDSTTGIVEWYGKPNAHSAQNTFRELFEGLLTPQIFLRWNADNTKFLYVGQVTIDGFTDNVQVKNGINTIQVRFSTEETRRNTDLPPPDGLLVPRQEGGKTYAQVSKYERDPRLRYECVTALGPQCRICSFDFEVVYGELGRAYCHVHHIRPLSEEKGSHFVDPIKDLIPVCPNCHAMLHARNPALTPDELRAILRVRSEK